MSEILRLEPGTGPIADDPSTPIREWTFMVYLAGDNSLEDFGRADLMEMKEVGSTGDLAIVAQFDRMQGAGTSQGATRRYYVKQGSTLEEDDVGIDLGETNTGDPRDLVAFISWAMNAYPAKRYALVLWNHGIGWKEDDVYRIAESSNTVRVSSSRLVPLVNGFAARTGRPVLFASTVNSVLARGIAYDDTSSDFLDNSEMKRAIGCALYVGQVDKLDLLGFDACLMNMLEVAYQVKDQVKYLVGSQETEPGEGWPYSTVLRALADEPTMDGQQLAAIVVDKYMASYGADENITQSALNLSPIGQVVLALDEMCQYVLENQQDCELIVGRASRRAQKYSDPDYKDLYDFCRLIYERSEHLPELGQRAGAVMDLIVPAGEGRFVCAEAHSGYGMSRSHGVSIYFPHHEVSPFYKRLDFASESLWDDMLHRLFGV